MLTAAGKLLILLEYFDFEACAKLQRERINELFTYGESSVKLIFDMLFFNNF